MTTTNKGPRATGKESPQFIAAKMLNALLKITEAIGRAEYQQALMVKAADDADRKTAAARERYEAARIRERRENLASAMLNGLLAADRGRFEPDLPALAVQYADALLAALAPNEPAAGAPSTPQGEVMQPTAGRALKHPQADAVKK